ncbi:myelin-oligodendrocyte glycoprotein-like, partial [Polyodon spathula]|uniref:myelin-oligodendrocyte glycoprotein-like n=1 Tax=Polyodon spathula TaxID=7913 RepID=UPI001B7DC462
MKMRFLGRTCLIVLSLLPAVSTQAGQWTVVGSDQPVIAEPGDDVILPCHISPRLSAVDMEVRWFRDAFEKPVHLYDFRKNILGTQPKAYQGRTALSPPALQTGDISLLLRNIQPSDRGVYTCLADDGSGYEEGQTELIVA